MKRIILSVVGVAFAGSLFAALRMGVPFADGMVLQREMKMQGVGGFEAQGLCGLLDVCALLKMGNDRFWYNLV